MKALADKWIYALGSPHFKATYSFNTIKYITEITIEQDLTPVANKKTFFYPAYI
jgi:hypothetical protein